jgi:hypothetical protein
LPPALSLGLDDLPSPCSTGLVLNLNGNAITVVRRFRDEGCAPPRIWPDG